MQQAEVSRAPAGKWIIAATVMLATYVAVIDITIVNVAMPQMMGTFGGDAGCHHLGGGGL